MPKVKTTTYKTVSLGFSKLEAALKEHLKLDKDYKLVYDTMVTFYGIIK